MHRRIVPDIVSETTVCGLPETATVFEAAQRMADQNVGAVVVTDESGKLRGIFTERDITRRVVTKGRDPSATPLADVMTPDPDVLLPDDPAMRALETMQANRYRHMPVVERNGTVVAVLSIRDLYEVYV